jgi:hypothetical protein
MTPPLAFQPGTVPFTAHLTEDQFGELLAASSRTSAPTTSPTEAHLLACEQCAAELAGLRQSLSLFRQASTAHADHELRQLPQMSIPARHLLTPAAQATWAFAAAATFLIALLPMQSFRQHTLQQAPTVAATASNPAAESDDALLNDINQEVSASVPAPMQALADPTAIAAASVSTSTQRKD